MTNWKHGVVAVAIVGALTAAGPSRELRRLNEAEIRRALIGKTISYTPLGTADTEISETFSRSGAWSGIHYGIGPSPFDGQWSLKEGKLCVLAASGTIASEWHSDLYCRAVWTDRGGGGLYIGYLGDGRSYEFGLQRVTVTETR